MGSTSITFEKRGSIAILTLNRPSQRNALDEEMWDQFDATLDELDPDSFCAIVITGAGEKAFCAGMDVNPNNPQIATLIKAIQKSQREPGQILLRRCRRTIDRLVAFPIPVIAAVNGLAYGGGAELAVRCDLRVVDPQAVICFSEVRLGLMPDWGGGVALTRLLGPSRAADLILTAREVAAKEALELGLVNRISQPGKALDEAVELANAIASNGPKAVRGALEVIRRTLDLRMDQALTVELDRASDLLVAGECVEGITALLSGKKPDFALPKSKKK